VSQKEHVKLFWTGGWDSTFRLLQLVIENKTSVYPYYIIDTNRSSVITEIKTLRDIKESIKSLDIQAYYRIKDIRFFSIHDINNKDINREAYLKLKDRSFLGMQYEWLSNFAEQFDIIDIELSVHKDDTTFFFLKNSVEYVSDPITGSNYQLRRGDASIEKEVNIIFKSFKFPLLDWTKIKMLNYAEKQGWSSIMDKTWFCHRPIRGKPCGICNPCRYTIQEDMSHRLPSLSILRYNTRYLYDMFNYIKKEKDRVKSLINLK